MQWDWANGSVEALQRTKDMDERILNAVRQAGESPSASPMASALFSSDTTQITLAATGSYGRGELCSHSDIDILVLHSLRDQAAVEDLAKAILYPLWDEGLELGYAVRTPSDCLQQAKQDPVIATTLFDVRFLAGAPDLTTELAEKLAKWQRKNKKSLEKSLLLTLSERHAQYGDAGKDLEPHIKEGKGGLRDLHTLRWLEDSYDTDPALNLLLSVRDTLHKTAERREDRIRRDQIEPMAKTLKCQGNDPRETLMEAIFLTSREIGARLSWKKKRRTQNLKQAAKNALLPADFSVDKNGLHRVSTSRPPSVDPTAGFLTALAAAQTPPSESLVAWAGGNSASQQNPIQWQQDTRDAFIAVLEKGTTQSWEFLDITGLWRRYLPELTTSHARMQHNPLHHLSVDAHCWEVVCAARSIAHDTELPIAKTAYADLKNPWLLLIAAFLHDIGKGSGNDHCRQGVILARRAMTRMGFGAGAEETIAFLIQHHLLLIDFATHRDLNDEELVLGLASRIRDPQRLRLLFLLSIADARATGPATWSSWKKQLLNELFVKLAAVIDSGDLVGREAQNRIARKEAELHHILGPEINAYALLDEFPWRYRNTVPVDLILTHLRLLDELHLAQKTNGDSQDLFQLHISEETISLISENKPGLISILAGVLAVHGVNVFTADIYTRSDDLAVDVVTAKDAHNDKIPGEKWQKIERDLSAAFSGKFDVEQALTQRSAVYDTKSHTQTNTAQVTVEIDNASSAWYSLIEVRCADRVGLLHTVACILSELGCDIHYAKVDTAAGQACDTFSVRNTNGEKLNNTPRVTAEIEAAIRKSLFSPQPSSQS